MYDQPTHISMNIPPLFMQHGREINGKLCGINSVVSTMYNTVHTGAICIRHERSGSKGWAAQSLRIIVILRNYVGYLCIRIQTLSSNESTLKHSIDNGVDYGKETITTSPTTSFDKKVKKPKAPTARPKS